MSVVICPFRLTDRTLVSDALLFFFRINVFEHIKNCEVVMFEIA